MRIASVRSIILPLLLLFLIPFIMTAAQDVPPPKPKPSSSAPEAPGKSSPKLPGTLVVRADIACRLIVDGRDRGTLRAYQLKELDVKLGDHLVEADSLEGADHWEKLVEINTSGQLIVTTDILGIKRAREELMRMQAEKAATDKRRREEEEAAEKTRRAVEENARLIQEERDRPYWVDQGTRLMWTREDSGKSLDWYESREFCSNLRLREFGNWRLPTIEELRGVYDATITSPEWHAKGMIKPTDWTWSGSVESTRDFALIFHFNPKQSRSYPRHIKMARALCVRNL
jgi:hypothetical protein